MAEPPKNGVQMVIFLTGFIGVKIITVEIRSYYIVIAIFAIPFYYSKMEYLKY